MDSELSPLQQEVLQRYERLSQSLHSLNRTIEQLRSAGSEESPEKLVQQMREIEVKIALIGTLLKGSVYSLVRQKNLVGNGAT